MNNCGMRSRNTETNGTLSPALSRDDPVRSSPRFPVHLSPLIIHSAIHCRNRLQSLQRARAAVEDSTSPSASEPSSGSGNLSSPSFSSPPTPSPPSPSGPLTPLPLLLKQRTPAGGPSQGNSSAATMIPVYDGEPDRQFDLGTSMESPQNGSYHIPPQMFQDGFAITPSTPTNPSSSCWQEPILPNEHWKDFPEGSSMTGGIVQSYQPPQILTIHVDFTSPLSDPSQSCIPFIMTCPVPHCCYQCQSVVEIWRHITWTHIRPRPEDGIEGIVEKVVLGNV